MITNRFSLGFYDPVNQTLLRLARRGLEDLRERWQDEASAAALAGRPERAAHIERWIARIA